MKRWLKLILFAIPGCLVWVCSRRAEGQPIEPTPTPTSPPDDDSVPRTSEPPVNRIGAGTRQKP